MNKTRFTIILLTLLIVPLLVTAFSTTAKAQPSQRFNVDVAHIIQINDNGGLLIINDTVKLSTNPGQTATLQNYTMGFPFNYKSNLDHALAYETKNPSTTLSLQLDVNLGQIGFYGINAIFPQTIDISNDAPYEFTVVTVFSDMITSITGGSGTLYNATFPAYPSLTQTATTANLTVILSTAFNFTTSSYNQQGITFNKTTTSSQQYFTYTKNNLAEFSTGNAWFTFLKNTRTLKIFDVDSIDRQIDFAGLDQITVTDSYAVVCKDESLSQITLRLSKGASGISGYDEFGSLTNIKTTQGAENTNVTVTFTLPYPVNTEARFLINYELPWKNYAGTVSWNDFTASLTLANGLNATIRKLTTTVNLPEGATLLTSSSQTANLNNVQSQVFANSFTLTYQNITPFNNPTLNFTYQRPLFWDAFRPTVWISFLTLIIGAVIGAWRINRPPTTPLPTVMEARVRPEDLKKFVDAYDERRRLLREIDSLETQARKGKVPRKVYRARRTTIDNRLTSMTRDLTALRDKIRTAGPRYADLMRQLEVAENELKGVEADINRAEVGYRRGEISAASYHQLLEGAYRRRDRARTTIDGVVLRVKEEIT